MSHILKTIHATLVKEHEAPCVLCGTKDYKHHKHSFPTEELEHSQDDLFQP